jgi:hypothetical protein
MKYILQPWSAFHLSYIDEGGRRIQLTGNSRGDFDGSSGPSKWNFPPGELGEQMGVMLSNHEVDLVRNHPVVFSVFVSDPTTGKLEAIESPPKILIQEK